MASSSCEGTFGANIIVGEGISFVKCIIQARIVHVKNVIDKIGEYAPSITF